MPWTRFVLLVLIIAVNSIGCSASANASPADKEKPKVTEPAKEAREWKAGDEVDIEWHSEWYAGVIVEVKSKELIRVKFLGWDNWQADVGKIQIRAGTADSKKGWKKD